MRSGYGGGATTFAPPRRRTLRLPKPTQVHQKVICVNLGAVRVGLPHPGNGDDTLIVRPPHSGNHNIGGFYDRLPSLEDAYDVCPICVAGQSDQGHSGADSVKRDTTCRPMMAAKRACREPGRSDASSKVLSRWVMCWTCTRDSQWRVSIWCRSSPSKATLAKSITTEWANRTASSRSATALSKPAHADVLRSPWGSFRRYPWERRLGHWPSSNHSLLEQRNIPTMTHSGWR